MKILILDYSVDQFETPLIEKCIPADIEKMSLHITSGESFPENILNQGFTHIVHSGSSHSINEISPFTERTMELIHEAVKKGIWQMGICYGHQLLCRTIVGEQAVRKAPAGFEAGWKKVWFLDSACQLLGVDGEENIWQHHFDEVVELPLWSELLATNGHSHIQAFINYELKILGTQFHPEFDESKGNAFFRKDRALLEEHGFDVDEMLQGKPSFDSRNVFFEFFLKQ